jgi:hypothetical protein
MKCLNLKEWGCNEDVVNGSIGTGYITNNIILLGI